MANVTNVKLEQTGSHHYREDNGNGRGGKEEVYGYFSATWRGDPVMVTMSCDRYTVASGEWTDWRVYAQDARQGTFYRDREDGPLLQERGPYVTDTARSRLNDACKPAMLEWLAGDEYPTSRKNALRYMILRQFSDDATGYYGPKRGREMIDRHAADLGGDLINALNAVGDAVETLQGAMEHAKTV